MSELTNRELVELVFTGKLPADEMEPPSQVIYDGSAEMVMFLGRVITMRNSKEVRIQSLLKACHLPPAQRMYENDSISLLKPYLACFMDRATWEKYVLPLKASQEKLNKVVHIADLIDERAQVPAVKIAIQYELITENLTQRLGISDQPRLIDDDEISLDEILKTIWNEKRNFHQQAASSSPEVIEIDRQIEALVQEVFA